MSWFYYIIKIALLPTYKCLRCKKIIYVMKNFGAFFFFFFTLLCSKPCCNNFSPRLWESLLHQFLTVTVSMIE